MYRAGDGQRMTFTGELDRYGKRMHVRRVLAGRACEILHQGRHAFDQRIVPRDDARVVQPAQGRVVTTSRPDFVEVSKRRQLAYQGMARRYRNVDTARLRECLENAQRALRTLDRRSTSGHRVRCLGHGLRHRRS